MMNKIFFIFLILFISTLSHAQKQFDQDLLLSRLQILSADSMEGRGFATRGIIKAQNYIINEFREIGLIPAFNGSYSQQFEHERKGIVLTGNNIAAVIPGSGDKIIVITAHYDHLGIKDGLIFNGADDNASGTAALFSIAEYFKNKKPDHTLFLAAVDAEEIGSVGAKFLLENFPLDTQNIVLNINLDMIAHNDKNELYACGTYFYPHLKEPLLEIETPVNLLYGHDSPQYVGSDNWTYSSDHRVFHRRKIPFIYFGVEDHLDYHKSTDIFKNINQNFFIAAVDLIIKAVESYDESLMVGN